MRQDDSGENRLWQRLDAAARAELAPIDTVHLSAREVLHESALPSRYAYFPITAVVSLVSTMESGASAEVAVVGREGMIGLAGTLGPLESPTAAVVRVPGTATRVPSSALRAARSGNASVREMLDLYTEARLMQVAQTAACNRLHSVEARLARWLLAIHDRIVGDEFVAPHELIADMLGVHRPTVSVALQRFHEQHVIERRGRAIVIADRAALERLTCECHRVVTHAFATVFAQPPADSGRSGSAALGVAGADPQAAATLEAMRDIAGRLLLANIREQEAREQAEAANRAKDEFLAMVSHELRAPLNAILGWCAILQARSEPALEGGLPIIERNARAQLKLVDDLLDAARLTSFTLKIQPALVNLVEVVETAIDTIRPAAAQQAVALSLAAEHLDDSSLFADADRLRQVLLNILTNSLKFTEPGGSIVVRLTSAAGRAQVIVQDTGTGIEAAVLPHVFEPFRQGGTSAGHAGLGLGLAICRAIVELHGGTITITSPGQNQGTTCRIELPLPNR